MPAEPSRSRDDLKFTGSQLRGRPSWIVGVFGLIYPHFFCDRGDISSLRVSNYFRHRQRTDKPPLESFFLQFRNQLIGYVPRQEQRVSGLVLIEVRFF
jgi:hypothetical protein